MQDLEAHLETAPASPAQAVVALGSNLGESHRILNDAVAAFYTAQHITVTAVSPRAQTAPVGGPEQPDFLNQVVIVNTTLSPLALLRFGQQLEQQAARVRDVRWGPRTLDVDIIDYQNVTSDDPRLTLPHPRAHQRAFVLTPWAWADPSATLHGQPVAELAALADDAATVHKIEDAS